MEAVPEEVIVLIGGPVRGYSSFFGSIVCTEWTLLRR